LTAPQGSAWGTFEIDLGTQFAPDNICDSRTIFSKSGRAACMALIESKNRDKAGSVTRTISDVSKDTDGFLDSNVNKVDHASLDACGTTQATVNDRIAHCAFVNGAGASWLGASDSNSGHGDWRLVTKVTSGDGGKEVWRDERTKLLWSDYLGNGVMLNQASQESFGWCFASGNTQNAGGVDCRIGQAGSFNRVGVSLCAEAQGLLTPNGVHNQVAAANNISTWIESGTAIIDGKGGMLKAETANSPSVEWRLPSRNDYMQAYVNGMGYVLQRMGQPYRYWTSTLSSESLLYAWYFSAANSGYVTASFGDFRDRDALPVRCVGR
jgi:hypothetical protein